jgi:hypothetical protein
MPRSWAGSIRVTHPCATLGTLLLTSLPSGLHVLGLPLAFILSQDQTLHSIIFDLECLAACSIVMCSSSSSPFARRLRVPIRQSILTCGARCPIPLSIYFNERYGFRVSLPLPHSWTPYVLPCLLCPFWPPIKPIPLNGSAKVETLGHFASGTPNNFTSATTPPDYQEVGR